MAESPEGARSVRVPPSSSAIASSRAFTVGVPSLP